MKKHIIPIALITFLLNFSCSRMIVNVSTADLKTVNKNTDSLMDRINAFKYSRQRKNIFSNKLFQIEEMNKMFENLMEEGKKSGFVNSDDSKTIIEDFQKGTLMKLSDIKNTYSEGVTLTEQENYSQAIDKYLDATAKTNSMNKWFISYFRFGKLDNYKKLLDLIESFESDIVSVPTKSKNNLLGDPLVSYITKKENKGIWKSQYNKTKSWTALGNSDIAIVLRDDPESYNNNYTIKGVRVDADKLIQSSFDFLAQSINVLASTQGISVPADTTNNYFAPNVIPAIQNLESEKNKLSNKEQMLEAYKEFIVLEILNRDLDNKSLADLKVSVEEIKSIWAKYKANIEKL